MLYDHMIIAMIYITVICDIILNSDSRPQNKKINEK